MTVSYIATPYTKFPRGIEAAFEEACRLTAALAKTGIAVYSPIVQGHALAKHGNINPLDQEFWGQFNVPMLYVCRTLIVAHMDGWEQSSGIAEEIKFFEERGRPIFDLDPRTLSMIQRREAARHSPLALAGVAFVDQDEAP
jgi:hypothetical protein